MVIHSQSEASERTKNAEARCSQMLVKYPTIDEVKRIPW
uniref:Uncharacterized protein n=1 Tax=Arundo donax TaxID=35708 RepID=A0A0A9GZR4_ARUDO